MNITRKDGFYWCKIKGEDWKVYRYLIGSWFETGSEFSLKDSDFKEIDENRIVR